MLSIFKGTSWNAFATNGSSALKPTCRKGSPCVTLSFAGQSKAHVDGFDLQG